MKNEYKTKKQLIDELVELRKQIKKLDTKGTKLKKVEDRFRLLKEAVGSMPIGITISDTEGKIVYTNLAEAKIHGYMVKELIGKNARILAPPELWKPISFEQLYEMGVWKRESINIRKNGELFPVHLISIAVKNIQGVPIGIITTCEEITERKEAEDRLKLLKEAVESLPIGITVCDVNGKIIFTNLAEAEIHGYTVQELIGKDARIFAPSELWKPMSFDELFKIGVWKRQSKNIRKNGEVFQVQLISIAVKNEKEMPIGIITACEDITERKRMDEELKTRVKELEDFYDMAVGREVKMKELKEEIEGLREELASYKKMKDGKV